VLNAIRVAHPHLSLRGGQLSKCRKESVHPSICKLICVPSAFCSTPFSHLIHQTSWPCENLLLRLQLELREGLLSQKNQGPGFVVHLQAESCVAKGAGSVIGMN